MLKKTNQHHFDSAINLYISKIWLDFVKMFNIFSSKIFCRRHELNVNNKCHQHQDMQQFCFQNKFTNRRSRRYWNGHSNISWKSSWSQCWRKSSSLWCYISIVTENIIDEKYGKAERHEWRIQRVSLSLKPYSQLKLQSSFQPILIRWNLNWALSFSLTEQIQFYLMQRFPTRQNHDYRMDPNDDPIYDEYTSSGNNVTEEDRHWNFNIGTVFKQHALTY